MKIITNINRHSLGVLNRLNQNELDKLRTDSFKKITFASGQATGARVPLRSTAERLVDFSEKKNKGLDLSGFFKGTKIGYALSGGGAKGSFQVGVLQYLIEVKHFQPDIIVGTSVGAVNAAKLSEAPHPQNPNYAFGLDGLTKIWKNLREDKDMYVPSNKAWKQVLDTSGFINQVKKDIEEVSKQILEEGANFIESLINPDGQADDVKKIWKKFEEKYTAIFESIRLSGALYSLEPILNKIRDETIFNLDLAQKSGIELRMIFVGYLSKKTFLVDQMRKLYEIDDPRTAIGTVKSFSNAVIASAAIPVTFKPPIIDGVINGKAFKEIGFDGGVTDVVGLKTCVDLGAFWTFAIMCSPLPSNNSLNAVFEGADIKDYYPHFLENDPDFMSKTQSKFLADNPGMMDLLNIADSGLNLAIDEVTSDDLTVDANDKIVMVIAPLYLVHGTEEIHPELIAINMDHGWMCAYDAMNKWLHPTTQDNFNGIHDLMANINLWITQKRTNIARGKMEKETGEAFVAALKKIITDLPQLKHLHQSQIDFWVAKIESINKMITKEKDSIKNLIEWRKKAAEIHFASSGSPFPNSVNNWA